MTSLRHRRWQQGSGVTQPLLGEDHAAADEDEPSTYNDRQIIKYHRFAWQDLLHWCLGLCSTLWESISGIIKPHRESPEAPVHLTAQQVEALEELQARVAVQYSADDPEHLTTAADLSKQISSRPFWGDSAAAHSQALLEQLWEHALPGEPFEVPSQRWKCMGWQGTNPATDFRGGGLIALQNLVHLARSRPELFDALLHKSQGQRARDDIPFDQGGRGGEYPFCAAAVNVTHLLIELLQLRNDGPWPRAAASRGFVPLLNEGPEVFGELFCYAMARLDSLWLDLGQQKLNYGYLDFNDVKGQLQQRLEHALARQPQSLSTLADML